MKLDYIFVALTIIGCGLSDPKVVVYENPEGVESTGSADSTASGGTTSDGTTSGGTTGGDAGLVAFKSSIGGAAKTTCAVAGCHSATPIAGKTLSASDDAKNRTAFLGYVGNPCDAAKLFGKISGSHSGGNKSAEMPKAKIEAWVAADPSCN